MNANFRASRAAKPLIAAGLMWGAAAAHAHLENGFALLALGGLAIAAATFIAQRSKK